MLTIEFSRIVPASLIYYNTTKFCLHLIFRDSDFITKPKGQLKKGRIVKMGAGGPVAHRLHSPLHHSIVAISNTFLTHNICKLIIFICLI